MSSLFLSACLMCQATTMDIITNPVLSEKNTILSFMIGKSEVRCKAPDGKFWDRDYVVAADNKSLFIILSRGSRESSWTPEAIASISVIDYAANKESFKPRLIPIITDLNDCNINKIYASSSSGDRLLISIHYCYQETDRGKKYRDYPYYLDTKTGKISPVLP